ncbi:hypothetical protein Unana1_03413 [Umbelopsis nana]
MQATDSPSHQQLLNPNGGVYLDSIHKVDSFITDALDIFNKAGTNSQLAQRQAPQKASDLHGDNVLFTSNVADASVNRSEKNVEDEEEEEEDDPHAVTWKLKLSPSMMILDTNILTVAGLEKVLEQLKINVQPQSQFEPSPTFDYDICPVTIPSARTVIINAANSIYPSYTSEPTGLAFYHKLMSTQLTNQCVNEFFSCYNEPIWYINRSTFMSTYNPNAITAWNSGDDTSSIDVLLQASVCSLSIGHLLLAHQKHTYRNVFALMETYHLRAREILEDYFDTLDIRVVKSLLMLSNPPNIVCGDRLISPHEYNVYRVLAFRIAEELGIFEIDRRKNSASANEQELESGKRLAWVILCMDFFSANNTTGNTGWIDLRHGQVDYPKPLPSESEGTNKSVQYLAQFSKMIAYYKTGYIQIIRDFSQTPTDIANVRGILEQQCAQLKKTATDYLELDIERQLYSDFEQISAAESNSQRRTTILGLKLHLHFYSFALTYYVSFISVNQLTYDMNAQGFQDRSVNRKAFSSNLSPSVSSPNQTKPSLASSPHSPCHTPQDNPQMSPQPSNEVAAFSSPLELLCAISTAINASIIMGLVESLLYRDAMTCHHDSMYWLLLLTHASHFVSNNSKDEGVLALCGVNITRARLYVERHPLTYVGEPRYSQLLNRLRIWQGISPDIEFRNPPIPETEILRSSTKELVCQLERRVGALTENSSAWSPPRPSRQPRQTTEPCDEDQQVKLEQYEERLGSNEDRYNSESSYED